MKERVGDLPHGQVLALPLAFLPLAELVVSISCVHLTSFCVGAGFTRCTRPPLSKVGSPRQGQRSVHLCIAGMWQGVCRSGQEKFVFYLLCVRYGSSSRERYWMELHVSTP